MSISNPTRTLRSTSKNARAAVARIRRRGQLGHQPGELRHDRYRRDDDRISLPRFY